LQKLVVLLSAQWGGPSWIEAWSLGTSLPSVLWHTHIHTIWPMCLVGC